MLKRGAVMFRAAAAAGRSRILSTRSSPGLGACGILGIRTPLCGFASSKTTAQIYKFTLPPGARSMSSSPTAMRNIAVIAHVDHGKTTLVDKLMEECSEKVTMERAMDSLDLEQERGITIMAKVTSMMWGGTKINLMDTPGHADFGGEVERVMSMTDGVLLLVDAAEGPMAQTKFVLSKALKRGLRPIVVINKVDKDDSRISEVESDLFDLFASLDATEEQLEFPIVYAAGRAGWADMVMDGPRNSMKPLLDLIVEHVPPPAADDRPEFALSVVMLGRDDFVGRLVTGRVASGVGRVGDPIIALNPAGEKTDSGKITKIFHRTGEKGTEELSEAIAGDIVQIAGLAKATVADTICHPTLTEPIKTLPIDPPTVCMTFSPNDSPLAGQEGSKMTSQLIWERLQKEVETNVSLQVKLSEGGEKFEVYGRGELQLGILIENMRREGFELSVSPPIVVFKDVDGKRHEPVEEVTVEVDDEYQSLVVKKLSERKGQVLEMKPSNEAGRTSLRFLVPSRGMLGYRSTFFTDTRGSGILNRLYHEHQPYMGELENVRKGVLISMASGKTTEYALKDLESRGTLFIGPRVDVYNGMIFGENSRDDDLEANPAKTKHQTNVRSNDGKDDFVTLTPPKIFNLEAAMAYIAQDEILEVTPKSVRMRKKELDKNKRQNKRRDAGKNK